jgi:hypothetical protein
MSRRALRDGFSWQERRRNIRLWFSMQANTMNIVTFPGHVELCTDNPMISLKDNPDGPFVTLATFFRVFHSPHGRGNVLVLLEEPGASAPSSDRINACFSDNEPLARYVVTNFLSLFGAYKHQPAMKSLAYRSLDKVEPSGDPRSEYCETMTAGEMAVEMIWSGLEEPFWFAYPPSMTATGKHYMLSLIHGAQRGIVRVNGRVLPGEPVPGEYAGHPVKSAILAFAENWIRV